MGRVLLEVDSTRYSDENTQDSLDKHQFKRCNNRTCLQTAPLWMLPEATQQDTKY